MWSCWPGVGDEKSRCFGVNNMPVRDDSEISAAFKDGRTAEQRQESCQCLAAETLDWKPQERRPDACFSVAPTISLFLVSKNNFDCLRSNHKRPLTSFQASTALKRLPHLVLEPRPQIAAASRWVSWKYFPLFFPPSRRHVNKAPSVAATSGRQWRRCASNCEWDEC